MKSKEADQLGLAIAARLREGGVSEAVSLLAPVLYRRITFRILERVALQIADAPEDKARELLFQIVGEKREGGWVIVGGVLGGQFPGNPEDVLALCRDFIIEGDVWYAADILGERVPGPALVTSFEQTLTLLSGWRIDGNRWVRRAVGVAVHFWAKRSRGRPENRKQAGQLLAFLEPLFEEREMDAVKGAGWGLKTLGKMYPDETAAWLLAQADRPHRALMLRKAITYLPDAEKGIIVRKARR